MFGLERIGEKKRVVAAAERIISGKEEMESTSRDVNQKINEQMTGWKRSVEAGVGLLSDKPHQDDIRIPFTLSYDTFAVVKSAVLTSRPEVLQIDRVYLPCESIKGNVLTCLSNAFQNEDGNISLALSAVELASLNGDLRRDMKYLPELLDVNLAFARDSGRGDITYSETVPHPLATKTVEKGNGW